MPVLIHRKPNLSPTVIIGSQTLLLPDNADKENIEAQVNNGVLKVVIPKLEKVKAEDEKREIEIK